MHPRRDTLQSQAGVTLYRTHDGFEQAIFRPRPGDDRDSPAVLMGWGISHKKS
jgi:hypothetical protein